jgi:3-dehydroquinate synthase
LVVCDLDTLKSLPAREVSAGLAEIIKYGPIADMVFLEWLESHVQALRSGDAKALAYAVQRSCEIKAWVVGQDEREAGLRAILNLGTPLATRSRRVWAMAVGCMAKRWAAAW